MPDKPDPLREATGKRLSALRGTTGQSKRDFAKEIGVAESRYTKWESGVALIPPIFIYELRQRYKITADWLYFGDVSGLPRALYSEIRKAA